MTRRSRTVLSTRLAIGHEDRPEHLTRRESPGLAAGEVGRVDHVSRQR